MVFVSDAACAERALGRFLTGAMTIAPLGKGLINETYLVEGTRNGSTERFVLQRVSPIFDPTIHHNLRAVTSRLASAGVTTPMLVPSREGAPWIELDDGGVWRLLTFVDGVAVARVQSPAQAASAGDLVGRFHSALRGLRHTFVGRRTGVHDTARHLARLQHALESHRQHGSYREVAELASSIESVRATLAPLEPLAEEIGHGDLKIDNVLFAGELPPGSERAVCLIDLDMLGPIQLAHELGDAWRSWCNPAGEEAPSRFDLAIFEASWRAYAAALGWSLDERQRRALVGSVEWISLELSARFARDTLEESYFGWDASRFASRGAHNLVRARSQWSLFESAVRCRDERARLLGVR